VVFVRCHEECEILVKLACKHNVVIIPFGGGTNVTHAVNPVEGETRMIVSCDGIFYLFKIIV